MKADGLALTPSATRTAGRRWHPDAINMRVNGYDFHVNLMAGKEDWAGDKVKKTFDTWKGLLELHQPDSLGRTWQEAAQSLQQKKSGMYLLGMFVAQQFEKGAEQDDLDFFTFPEIDSAIGADAIEAPIDGYMMSASPKNDAGAKALLKSAMSAAPRPRAGRQVRPERHRDE